MIKKKKQPSAQELAFNYKATSIQSPFPHLGKECGRLRVLSGRGFGKTCMIRMVNDKPVIIGNGNGIKIIEEQP